MIYFLMGKSASGKDGLGRMLLGDASLSLRPVVLYTTRPMRDGEQEGREYHFCTANDLETFRSEGKVIEERVYHTVQGDWYYFTLADDDLTSLLETEGQNILAIGTLEAYLSYRDYFGADRVVPLYIEVRDDLRLMRSIEREMKNKCPDLKEVCRRYLADEEDFSEDKLQCAGIDMRFSNDGTIEECFDEVKRFFVAAGCSSE